MRANTTAQSEWLEVACDPNRPNWLPLPEMARETVVDRNTGEILCEAGRVLTQHVPGCGRVRWHLGVVIPR